MDKEQLVTKLLNMLREQEKLISYVKHKLKVDGHGNFKLETIEIPRSAVEENHELLRLRVRTKTQKESYSDLLNNFEDLKVIQLKVTEDWSKAEHKVKVLEREILEIKEKYNLQIEKMKEEFKLREMQLLSEKENLSKDYIRYQDDLKQELKVNEELVKRYSGYTDHLKKQVVVCKNVIKSPQLMTSAMRKYNYKELKLYKYENSRDEQLAYQDNRLNTAKNHDRSSDRLFMIESTQKINQYVFYI